MFPFQGHPTDHPSMLGWFLFVTKVLFMVVARIDNQWLDCNFTIKHDKTVSRDNLEKRRSENSLYWHHGIIVIKKGVGECHNTYR